MDGFHPTPPPRAGNPAKNHDFHLESLLSNAIVYAISQRQGTDQISDNIRIYPCCFFTLNTLIDDQIQKVTRDVLV